MKNPEIEVLEQLTQWLQASPQCWLATVVSTWGSSPRPVGSLLACDNTGRVVGSLSGGCVEEDLLQKLTEGKLARDRPELLIYGATQEESERLGLPCGGQLHVVIEPLDTQRHQEIFQRIVARLSSRGWIERRTDISSGKMIVKETDGFKRLRLEGFAEHREASEAGTLVHTYGPACRMLLIGAGQVSAYLSEMAQKLDYQVVVCDPRRDFLDQWTVEGVQLIADMPDDAVRKYAGDGHAIIIALTHDPRFDDMALMEALKTEALFIGAIGSTRTSARRRERLVQLDLKQEEINRLHAPVGLPIGSKTPAEIAISILAQLTALRSDKEGVVEADYRIQATM